MYERDINQTDSVNAVNANVNEQMKTMPAELGRTPVVPHCISFYGASEVILRADKHLCHQSEVHCGDLHIEFTPSKGF